MLTLVIPEQEFFDSKKEMFITLKKVTIRLEHSLVAISKWESKWNKPFLSDKKKTEEETIDYIKCMTITQNVPDEVYMRLTKNEHIKIANYINLPMTATTFLEDNMKDKKTSGIPRIITTELMYYYMIALSIPFECQKWHLNRLLTLIRVCSAKNSPKKMSKQEIYERNNKLNKIRKAKLKSKG